VPQVPGEIGAIVVDHEVGPLLDGCVRSLLGDGASPVVVVENGTPGSTGSALKKLFDDEPTAPVNLVRPGRNLGFGAGVNRGLAALAGAGSPPEWVLVSNADLEVHPGALSALRAVLESHPAWALVGPKIYTETGDVYPSVRNFPSFTDAAGHALFALLNPDNPFTRRYNPGAPEGDVVTGAGWVSGSCFLARRSALEELGGFDESYFMYLEDTDLCWRAHDAGWGVGFAGTAAVTHLQGVSTAQHPYRMLVAHHRSALRFTFRTTQGWRRVALPLAVPVLGVRLAIATLRLALTR
jgi:N-acetylglucosaminyl-diphospho-decaprenol L-rhamnosyltransferase